MSTVITDSLNGGEPRAMGKGREAPYVGLVAGCLLRDTRQVPG